MPQNFWNRVNPPSPPPFNVQKRVKIGENKTTSKLLDSGWTPPPFGQCPKERCFFSDGFPESSIWLATTLQQIILTVRVRRAGRSWWSLYIGLTGPSGVYTAWLYLHHGPHPVILILHLLICTWRNLPILLGISFRENNQTLFLLERERLREKSQA